MIPSAPLHLLVEIRGRSRLALRAPPPHSRRARVCGPPGPRVLGPEHDAAGEHIAAQNLGNAI